MNTESVSSERHIESDVSNGSEVSSRGISTIAAQAAMSAHGVVDVHVSTKGTGTTPVRLRVDAAVYPGANVKRAGSKVREAGNLRPKTSEWRDEQMTGESSKDNWGLNLDYSRPQTVARFRGALDRFTVPFFFDKLAPVLKKRQRLPGTFGG